MRPAIEWKLRPENAAKWCLAMNNLGLIAVHRGNSAEAAELCRSQIDRLHLEFGNEAQGTPGMILALQPLVNLIRLLAPPSDRETFWDAIRMKHHQSDAPAEHSVRELCTVLTLQPETVEAVRKAVVSDQRANGYIDGLIARDRAQRALARRDPALLRNAAILAAGALANELDTVAHFWTAASADVPPVISWETRPQGHPLIQLYHLLKTCPSGALDADLVECACRDALKRARALLDADLLDLAFEYLEVSRTAGADHHKLSALVAEYADSASTLEDEVAAISAERFAVDYLSAPSDRLDMLLSMTGYRGVKKCPSRGPNGQERA